MHVNATLGQEELAFLSRHFRLNADPDPCLAVRTADLLDPRTCETYLHTLAEVLRAPSALISASLFAKKYAFLVVANGCCAMSMFDKQLDLSPDNSLIVWPEPRRHWTPQLGIVSKKASQPETDRRDEWRDRTIRRLFAEHLAKLWRVMAKAAPVPRDILWENTAVRLYSLYEKRLAIAADPQTVRRIRDDYEYLVLRASGDLFGEKMNPLAKFFGPITGDVQERPVRIRRTCCFNYMVSAEEGYCSNCPKDRRA